MKSPLHYQVSEFDCGPTTVLNALSYLFQREDLPAELVRNIMIYCLDCYNEEGRPGGNGTSRAAMMFLSNWPVSYTHLDVYKRQSEDQLYGFFCGLCQCTERNGGRHRRRNGGASEFLRHHGL